MKMLSLVKKASAFILSAALLSPAAVMAEEAKPAQQTEPVCVGAGLKGVTLWGDQSVSYGLSDLTAEIDVANLGSTYAARLHIDNGETPIGSIVAAMVNGTCVIELNAETSGVHAKYMFNPIAFANGFMDLIANGGITVTVGPTSEEQELITALVNRMEEAGLDLSMLMEVDVSSLKSMEDVEALINQLISEAGTAAVEDVTEVSTEGDAVEEEPTAEGTGEETLGAIETYIAVAERVKTLITLSETILDVASESVVDGEEGTINGRLGTVSGISVTKENFTRVLDALNAYMPGLGVDPLAQTGLTFEDASALYGEGEGWSGVEVRVGSSYDTYEEIVYQGACGSAVLDEDGLRIALMNLDKDDNVKGGMELLFGVTTTEDISWVPTDTEGAVELTGLDAETFAQLQDALSAIMTDVMGAVMPVIQSISEEVTAD